MSDLRAAHLLRLGLQVAVALGLLLGVQALAHLPLGAPPEGAAIRLAVRTSAGKLEICRDVPPEELAQLPIHMRQSRICEVQPVAYRLTLSVDGVPVRDIHAERRGMRSDRALVDRRSRADRRRTADAGRRPRAGGSNGHAGGRRRGAAARRAAADDRSPGGTHRSRDLGSERRADGPAVDSGGALAARPAPFHRRTERPYNPPIVFPLPSHLLELAALSTVQLADTPFPLLLVAHQAAESTGLLVARRGPIEKRVVLDHGVPVECRSNLAHETFSRFLAASGRLTATEANTVLARSVARGVLLGEILVSEGQDGRRGAPSAPAAEPGAQTLRPLHLARRRDHLRERHVHVRGGAQGQGRPPRSHRRRTVRAPGDDRRRDRAVRRLALRPPPRLRQARRRAAAQRE